MPPDPTNAIEHSDLVVYDSSSESEFEEDEDPLPPPVDVDTPFEFDRIADHGHERAVWKRETPPLAQRHEPNRCV